MTNFISDLNSDRHHFLFIFLFFKYFFQKMHVARQWLTHATFFFFKKIFFKKRKWHNYNPYGHTTFFFLIFFFSKNASGKTIELLRQDNSDYSSKHMFFDWER